MSDAKEFIANNFADIKRRMLAFARGEADSQARDNTEAFAPVQAAAVQNFKGFPWKSPPVVDTVSDWRQPWSKGNMALDKVVMEMHMRLTSRP